MKLTLTNGIGEAFLVDVEPEDTFQDLKNQIKQEYGIPLDLQSLKFKGDRPVDTQNVMEYIKKVSAGNQPKEKKSTETCHLCTIKSSTLLDLKTDSKSMKKMLESVDFTAGVKNSLKLSIDKDISFAKICSDCAKILEQCQKLRDTCTEAQSNLEQPLNPELNTNHEVGKSSDVINLESAVLIRESENTDDTNQILLNITEKNSGSIIISKFPDHGDIPPKLINHIILDENYFQVGLKQTEYEAKNVDKYFSINDLNKASTINIIDSLPRQSTKANFNDQTKALNLRALESEDQYIFQENIEEIIKCQSTDQEASSRPELVGCQKCSEAFTSLKRLWAHSATHHVQEDKQTVTGLVYPCAFCEDKFSHLQYYAKHFDAEHSNYSGKPPSPQKSNSSGDGDVQVEMCRVCSTCDQVFALKDKPSCCLHSDQKNVRSLALVYECEKCSVKFSKVATLLAHRSLCSMKNDKSLTSHPVAVSTEITSLSVASIFVCSACCYLCSSRSELTAHGLNCPVGTRSRDGPQTTLTTTTSTGKMWNCGSCNQLFASARELYRHKRGEDKIGSSTVELTTYICDRCDKAFGSMCALHTHVKMHSKTKPGYPCKVCGRRFNQSGHLAIHMRMHTGERPYPCDLCTKAFKVKVERDDHRRTHTNERPFACGTCGKTFTAAARLREHTRIHTDQRPYKCNICGAAFRRPYARTVHTLIHTGEKPHECNVCGTAFRRSGDMWKHKRTLHGITPSHKSTAVPWQ